MTTTDIYHQLREQNTLLRRALAYLGKHPEECTEEGEFGMCVSHAAYLGLTKQLEEEGWRYDEETDKWVFHRTS